MKTANSVLMKQAKESLSGNWGLAMGVFFIYFLIAVLSKGLSLIVSGPLFLGIATFLLALSRKQNPHIDQLFSGFHRFGTSLLTYLLVSLYTFLWFLLLIIPGIIASLSYSMTFFILADNPELGPKEAIEKSKKMMMGYKWKLFCLGLRFFGWTILALLTFGIGFLWLVPYMEVAKTKFYEDIKNG